MNPEAEQGAAEVTVRWWNSTPAKLVSGVLALTLAAGTAVWSIVAEEQERLFLEQRIREAGITSSVLARDFAEPMSGGAGGAVWSALNARATEFTRRGLAARVLVFLRDGRLMSASEPSAVGTRIEVRGNPECPACDSARAEDFPASAEVTLAGAHLNLAAVNSRNYTGAITDALTGLKNKRYGLARLEEAVNFARRRHAELGLAMCDIDHFKRVNDDYGHPAGDAILRGVARRIAACLRKSDIAVRYGGEEFMLILPEAAPSGLVSIGEKIRSAVQAAPLGLGASGGSVALTLSVGLAAFRADPDSAETLIARADAALYRAKENGRNRVVVEWPEAKGSSPGRAPS